MLGIYGIMSSGKTLSAIPFLVEEKEKKIISNIRLFGIKYEFLSNIEFIKWYYEMIQIKDIEQRDRVCRDKFEDTLWFIDEIGKIVPSRKRSVVNEIFNDFITMVGKLNCFVIYTSQLYESQVDKIFRELTPILIDCTRVNKANLPVFSTDRVVPYETKIRQKWTCKMGETETYELILDPKKYYKYYKTKELLFENKFELRELEKRLK